MFSFCRIPSRKSDKPVAVGWEIIKALSAKINKIAEDNPEKVIFPILNFSSAQTLHFLFPFPLIPCNNFFNKGFFLCSPQFSYFGL